MLNQNGAHELSQACKWQTDLIVKVKDTVSLVNLLNWNEDKASLRQILIFVLLYIWGIYSDHIFEDIKDLEKC